MTWSILWELSEGKASYHFIVGTGKGKGIACEVITTGMQFRAALAVRTDESLVVPLWVVLYNDMDQALEVVIGSSSLLSCRMMKPRNSPLMFRYFSVLGIENSLNILLKRARILVIRKITVESNCDDDVYFLVVDSYWCDRRDLNPGYWLGRPES